METRVRASDNAAMEDLPNLLDRIQVLVDGRDPSAPPERLLERMEHTLTDGYARALALEGEHLRIAREIGASNGSTRDELAERLVATEGDLEHLRATLVPLREQTRALASVTRSRS